MNFNRVTSELFLILCCSMCLSFSIITRLLHFSTIFLEFQYLRMQWLAQSYNSYEIEIVSEQKRHISHIAPHRNWKGVKKGSLAGMLLELPSQLNLWNLCIQRFGTIRYYAKPKIFDLPGSEIFQQHGALYIRLLMCEGTCTQKFCSFWFGGGLKAWLAR